MTSKILDNCGETLLNYAEALEEFEDEVEYARNVEEVDNQEEAEEIYGEIKNTKETLKSTFLPVSEELRLINMHPEDINGQEKEAWVDSESDFYEEMVDEGYIDPLEKADPEPTELLDYAFEELKEKDDELVSEYNELRP